MTWLEASDGDYVNGAAAAALFVVNVSGDLAPNWYINAGLPGGATKRLKGAYANQTDAKTAARKLCQGVDPTTII